MSTLDVIATRPNRDWTQPDSMITGKIVCADGFTISVISGIGTYCTPRNNQGPYTKVEVGFPSARPEPWDKWSAYQEIVGFDEWVSPHSLPPALEAAWLYLQEKGIAPKEHVEVDELSEEAAGVWNVFRQFMNDPTQLIYPYVPVDMVRDLIELHGGEA